MEKLLEMKNITKVFAVVKALDNVSFELRAGEIHALMGENGAGKSTLMNVLSGGLAYFDGEVFVEGQKVELRSPSNAQEHRIAKIHQELQLVPYLSVAENIFMGREKSSFGFVNFSEMNAHAIGYLQELEMDIDPTQLICDLRVGEQQMVEIAKALSMESRILIMDEPTSAISKAETEDLFRVIRKLRKQGVGIIYITHRMEEVFTIADRVTIMRDGKYISTVEAKDSTEEEIISMMVGRSIDTLFPKMQTELGKEVLRVENLCYNPPEGSFKRRLENISLSIKEGEVLGIAGLMGSGRSEFCESLFGAHAKRVSGDVFVGGEKQNIRSPKQAIKAGISFATEDRKGRGLVLQRSIGENMSLPLLKEYSGMLFMQEKAEEKDWQEQMNDLKIKAPSVHTLASNLSGGNQQKVILGRWLLTKPKLLILDEPTRGIDVGAKAEIYRLINDLAAKGMAVLVVSSDMPELLGLSNRILTFCEGRLTGEFAREEATQEKLLWAATRTKEEKNATIS